jgi:hypothetical protein
MFPVQKRATLSRPMTVKQIYRQGDLILVAVESIPAGAIQLAPEDGRIVLARRELTGYAHVFETGSQVPQGPRRGDKPSPEATIERAFSMANETMFTIAMQCRRLRSAEPDDQQFPLRWWADLQFLIIALRRLKLAAHVARKARSVCIDADIRVFESALPGLKTMRDTGEHVDEYAVDSSKRKNKAISRRRLHVGSWDGTTFTWLGGELNVESGRLAAEQLFAAIRRERDKAIVRARNSKKAKSVGD